MQLRFGGEAVSLALKYSQNLLFRKAPYRPFALNGESHGRVREYGNFSFVVVENSG